MDGNPRAVRILGLVTTPGASAPGVVRIIGQAPKKFSPGKAEFENKRLPYAWIFSAALVFSIIQLYVIPAGGLYISFGLLSSYSLIFLIDPAELWTHPLSKLFLALFVVQAFSMLWSPAPAQALREIVFSAPFLITFLAARQVASKNPRVIVKSLYIFCMMGALHSLLVLMMLFAPFLKTAFFASPVAFLFINQNSLDAISSGAQVTTTFGSDKSPGFFVNPNVAGVWSAVAFAATILVRRYRKSVLLNAAALLDLGAIGASGSKASLGLLVLVPLIAWLVLKILPPVGQRRRVVSTVMYALVLGAAAYGARLALDHASFMENSEHTLLTRSIMWQHAVNQFFITPWLGQGFGGWTLSFAPVGYAYQYLGIQPTFPPHNSLIILWSQSGLAALALGMMIIFYLLRISIAPRQDPDALMLCYCALGAYLFVLIQAMGENYGIVGDIHIKIPLAAILGWASIYEKRTARE